VGTSRTWPETWMKTVLSFWSTCFVPPNNKKLPPVLVIIISIIAVRSSNIVHNKKHPRLITTSCILSKKGVKLLKDTNTQVRHAPHLEFLLHHSIHTHTHLHSFLVHTHIVSHTNGFTYYMLLHLGHTKGGLSFEE
jgi:hypothetical protein